MSNDLRILSNEQLVENLHAIQRGSKAGTSEDADRVQEALQELSAHRIELEMQNRALREAQGEIEQVLRRYSVLYDRLPIGYVTLSAHGRIVEANLTAASWVGMERPQLVGRYLRSFVIPPDAERFASYLEQCCQTDGEHEFETTLCLAQGKLLPVQLSSSGENEGVSGERQVHVAITNVAGLKEAQRIAADLTEEHEALSESISHDLRAPLVTISNYAGIVLGEFGETLVDPVRSMVSRMEGASQRMDATLQQLLSYSNLALGAYRPEVLDTESVVRGVVRQHRASIEERNAAVEVGPLPRVRAASRFLSVAIENLLSNAIKFTAPRERPNVSVTGELRHQFVIIHVRDHGIGIDPRYHDRIFRLFTRLHGYSAYPGSGLGLAIARRAIDRMDGRLWFDSAVGQGTTFHLLLPAA